MAAVVADAVGASLKHPLEPLSVDEIAAAGGHISEFHLGFF